MNVLINDFTVWEYNKEKAKIRVIIAYQMVWAIPWKLGINVLINNVEKLRFSEAFVQTKFERTNH